MQYLTSELYFPPISQTSPQGILAAGGDLSPDRLLLAYQTGIFPWFEDNDPILWWCPEERMVLFFDELKISHSMRNIINKGIFTVTFNTCFETVMKRCQQSKRAGQHGTWISDDMIASYTQLSQMGKAMSVEVWQNEILVGGLYGVDLGHIFCGESMFSAASNASKMAFISLVTYLKERNYKLLDCQIYNDHLYSLGCREIPRTEFLNILQAV